jgi:hypothetical protein
LITNFLSKIPGNKFYIPRDIMCKFNDSIEERM